MATTARTFRIFVSSTFSDLKAERNALQEKVFPRLRDLASVHGCRFQAIDLRWGVSEESALDQQTMKICLGEIKHCQNVSPKPNFIILIGDRYGWRPLPYEIPADEYDLIIQYIKSDERALVEEWYLRDDNNVPPIYMLKPRTGAFEVYETWEPVEYKLHAFMEAAAKKAKLTESNLKKYIASATEQEIIHGALQVADAREHIFCFARETEAIPFDQSAKEFIDFQQGMLDVKASKMLNKLKIRLKKLLGENYHQYNAYWFGKGPSLKHLNNLCEDVYCALEQVILREVAELKQVDPLEQEIAAHQDFGEQRARHFIGQVNILKQIDDYLLSQNNQPLAIWGSSGSGKSALLSRVTQEAVIKYSSENILCRFIGATPDSSNGRSLLKSLCLQITRLYGGDESALPSTYFELVSEFPDCLGLAAEDKPLIIFIDAIDQLSDVDNARNLTWLPALLPAHVKLVVSTLPGDCLQELKRKLPLHNCLELKPMPLIEGGKLLDLWLEDAGRRLMPIQRTDLLKKFELNGLPLYLKLAFEEARRWHSSDGLPKGADDIPGMGEDIPGILNDLLWRLSKESNHGRIMVERSLSYLASAKNGLSEDELIDILSLDNEVIADFMRRSPKSPKVNRLPVVILSRLFFDLKPYFTEVTADETTLLRFYHRQLGEVVFKKYLDGQESAKRHLALADYFEEKDVDARKIEELPWQLAKAGEWKRLSDLMADWFFFEFAWAHDHIDMQRYWAQVEANSQFRMVDTYKSILQHHGDKLMHIGQVADLLGYAYHHKEAAALRTYLLEQRRGETNPLDLANTLNARGVSLKNTGDLEGAMKAYKEAEEIYRNLGEHGSLATILGNQGNVLRRQEKLDQALSVLKDAVQTSRKFNNQYGLLSCLNAISLVYFDLEKYEKSLTCIEEQKKICQETGNQMGLAAALCNQVSALEKLWKAEPEELLALLRQESEIYKDLGIHPKREESLTRQAKILKRQARSLYKQSIVQKEKKAQEKVIAIYCEEERIWNELDNIEGMAIAQSKRALVMALLGQSEARSVVEHAYALAVNNGLTNTSEDIHKTLDLVCSTLDQ